MKILAIDQGQHLGGAERFLSDLLKHLQNDIEIAIVYGGNPKYKQLYQGSNIQLFEEEMPSLSLRSVRSFKDYTSFQKRLRKHLDAFQPDLVLSNTVRTHLLSSPLVKKLNIPLLWMVHDTTFPKPLWKLLQAKADKKVCCSQYVADVYKIQEAEIIYPFGIDTQRLGLLKDAEKEPIIGMVGKFIPWKGQLQFLKAAKVLSEELPDYRFVLVADEYQGVRESHQYAKKCRDYISQNHLEGRVRIISGIQDLYSELAKWEVLVHCSQKPEPLGRVILEGMAAGCLVLAPDSGGPREIVQEGINGLRVSGRPEDISQAILKHIKDQKQLTTLQKNAQQWVAENFLWEKKKEKALKVFRSVR